MDLTPGLRRLALLLAALGMLAIAFGPTPAAAQKDKPACSNGIDDDADNAVDGADAGCSDGDDDDETDSPYAQVITVALPVVTLQGTVDANGTVDVKRLLIRAERGSVVRIRCSGSGCPAKRAERLMLTTKLRLEGFQRKLKPRMTITLKIAKEGQLGKYVRYEIRRNRAPVREDDCVDAQTGRVRHCFLG